MDRSEVGQQALATKHFNRSEKNERSVHENESIYIPIGSIHRLANPGTIPLELIEVQVGSYLGEDDIVASKTSTGA